MRVLAREDLPALLEALRQQGREIVGPTVRDGAIVYDEIEGTEALPRGWTDRQAPGRYRLERRDDDAYFGFAAGPGSWKDWLFPPRETLYRARRREDGKVGFDPVLPEAPPRAFVGVRACELAAMRVQDRTYLDGPHVEPRYRARREAALLVAVNCTEAGDLCFCASTDTGPEVGEGADLVLTELADRFVVEARSERGEGVLDRLPTEHAGPDDRREVEEGIDHAVRTMGRSMDTENLPGILFGNLDHPRWDDVAERCLSCGNCTNVCPTCFCATCESSSSLDGSEGERTRSWDSCFTSEHGEIHGHNVRPTILDRYRQWLTHKVGSWVSQFGTSGCVGCGRCIAWCPVGIDLTEEVAAIRAEAEPAVSMPERPQHTPRDAETQVPRAATVTAVTRETHDTVTLHVEDPGGPSPEPGQFHMLSLPGVGEAPISSSGFDGIAIEQTVRSAGQLTRALTQLPPHAQLGLRGPYGTLWPLETAAGRPVVVVAGGIGLAPLRGALRQLVTEADRYPDVRLFYGGRHPEELLYTQELIGWVDRPSFRLHVTVDRAPPSWRGHVGVVTRLLTRDALPEDATYMVCGPEVMMRFTVQALEELGVGHERIYISMERHMKCAAGFCGRCQLGPHFVCKDGPVFRFDRVASLFGHHGY